MTRISLILAALAFAACVVQEPENALPNLPNDPGNDGMKTVAGVDADADGLRDDVQIHIHNTYPETQARKAATQLAKALQALLTEGGKASGALAAGAAMNKAIDCLYAIDGAKFGDRVEDVEGVVVNTGTRAKAYAKAGAFLSGGSYSVSTVANNSASCEEAP
jgi:hypothetical protein